MIAEQSDPGFAGSRECFDEVVGWLDGAEAGELEHADLEDHLDLRAQREARLAEVVDVHVVRHGTVEDGHIRGLGTVFGQVSVPRLAYRPSDTPTGCAAWPPQKHRGDRSPRPPPRPNAPPVSTWANARRASRPGLRSTSKRSMPPAPTRTPRQ